MTHKPAEYRDALVSCLSCGSTSSIPVRITHGKGLHHKARCPKCSNQAYTQNLMGLWCFMEAAAKDIAQIKMDMIDLQDDPEDR